MHIEVQGQKDKAFGRRMFDYYYHIRNKYGDEVVAWAIFTDSNMAFKPTEYHFELLGTSNTYRFNTYKILEQDEQALRSSNNPFAVAVLAVQTAIKNKRKPPNIVDIWVEIARNLFKTDMPPKKLSTVLNFIKQIIRFTPEESNTFVEKLENITTKPAGKMSIEELIIKAATQRGIKRGEQRGIKLGEERGIKLGEERGIKLGEERAQLIKDIAVVKNGIRKGLDLALIAELLGKTLDEVEALIKKHDLK